MKKYFEGNTAEHLLQGQVSIATQMFANHQIVEKKLSFSNINFYSILSINPI